MQRRLGRRRRDLIKRARGQFRAAVRRSRPATRASRSSAACPSGGRTASGCRRGRRRRHGGAGGGRSTNRHPIVAPLVGTFYRAPPARAPTPFVKVGDVVEPGQTVAIVEAMKLMNQVQSTSRARSSEILVEDGAVGRVRAGADVPRAVDTGTLDVREGPDREPRRDRAARRARVPRARASSASPCTRPPTRSPPS